MSFEITEKTPAWLLWEFKHWRLATVRNGKVIPANDPLDAQQVTGLGVVNRLARMVLEGDLVVEFDGEHDPIYKPSPKVLVERERLSRRATSRPER